jgi:hypothetical protein
MAWASVLDRTLTLQDVSEVQIRSFNGYNNHSRRRTRRVNLIEP